MKSGLEVRIARNNRGDCGIVAQRHEKIRLEYIDQFRVSGRSTNDWVVPPAPEGGATRRATSR